MKTALVLCPKWSWAFPAASLALLAGALRSRGHEAEVFDLNQEMFALALCTDADDFDGDPNLLHRWTLDRFVEDVVFPKYRDYLASAADRILRGDCRVVGFSVFFSNTAMTMALARMLKKLRPDVKIVLGGPSCLSHRRCLRFLEHEEVDAVVFGEGDLALPAIVEGVERAGRIPPSPGVMRRRDPASWGASQAPVEDLDGLPHADYTGHRLALYPGVKTINTCRGCVRRCVFCSDWREMSYRQMSGERIFAEFAHQLARHPDVRSFMLGDSIINGSMRALGRFCDLATSERLGARWHGHAIVRPEMTRSFLERMRAAGCETLIFGVESGSEGVLRDARKHVPPTLNGAVLRDAVRSGIRTVATWLVGYPTETEERFQESIDFIRTYREGISHLTLNFFAIQELDDEPEPHGFRAQHSLFWSTPDGSNTFPVRIDRLKRLMKAADEAGVDAKLQAAFPSSKVDARCAELLAAYRRLQEGAPPTAA